MLNYILPPIIIVISLSILMMFLFRKMQQVPMQEFIDDQPKQQKKWIATAMSAIGQFGLKILEHLMQKFKLISLKFHNVSNDWFHSIREKRQNHREQAQQEMAKNDVREAEKRERIAFDAITHKNSLQVQKKPVRPLIREAVVNPQPVKPREKNQLEEALIKRIAINPKDIEAYERLGDYYLESESYQDSQECFKQVLKLSPTHQKAQIRMRKIEVLMK